MSVVGINPRTGRYFDQKRGSRRGETSYLVDAQIFPSVSKAKIAYNHMHATWITANKHNEKLRKMYPDRTDIRTIDIPPFATQEVAVVVTGKVINHG